MQRTAHPTRGGRLRRTARATVVSTVAAAVFASGIAAQEAAPAPASADTVVAESPVSGRAAFLRSLVLPGWGQAYVGAPGRGAVYFTLEAGSLWMTYKSWRQLREARDLQAWLRETGELPATEKLGLVESREGQFEDWVTLSIFLLLFSGADAFVTAQLADFGEHIGVAPEGDGALRLEATLPVGRRR